jgi:predicted nucleotidyltransferase component of viral defense system
MNTATQLKALIRNLAKQKSIDAQILLRNYMLERLLERISLSEYKNNFILKGGMLVAAMVGLDSRSTIDMDATIKGKLISAEAVGKMFESILSVDLEDYVEMKIKSIEEIHEEAEYSGIRVSIETVFDKIRQLLKVDVTTGEDITPREVSYSFRLMLEDRDISIMAYNLETVLAEKLETVITRSITNTRMRDFYDIFILSKLKKENINNELLKDAIKATAKRRGTYELFSEANKILEQIDKSTVMKDSWKRYQAKFSYAEEIEWEEVMQSVKLKFEGFTEEI